MPMPPLPSTEIRDALVIYEGIIEVIARLGLYNDNSLRAARDWLASNLPHANDLDQDAYNVMINLINHYLEEQSQC